MKTNLWPKLAFALALAFCNNACVHAQTPPQPVMVIQTTGTNQLSITITNGVTNVNYELWTTPILGDPLYPWTLLSIGAPAQTNFTVDMDANLYGFYITAIGSDFDGDGVPNYKDANPNDATIGVLTITIDSPTNGFIFN